MRVSPDDMFVNLGQLVEPRTSYLIQGKTVKGEPVLKLDQEKDYKVDNDPALVVRRKDPGGKWAWYPIKDLKEFRELFSRASIPERREDFGVWEDSRKWVVIPKDGIPQEEEVTTFGQRWDEYTYCGQDTVFNAEYKQDSAWIKKYTQTLDKEVKIKTSGTVTEARIVFEEPQKVTKEDVEVVKTWEQKGNGWHPCQTVFYSETMSK